MEAQKTQVFLLCKMAELLTDIVQSKIVFVNNSSYICRVFLSVNRGDRFVFHTFQCGANLRLCYFFIMTIYGPFVELFW